jgi:hypothetical protein
MSRSTRGGMMDSDTLVRRIFAAYCGVALALAPLVCALMR